MTTDTSADPGAKVLSLMLIPTATYKCIIIIIIIIIISIIIMYLL